MFHKTERSVAYNFTRKYRFLTLALLVILGSLAICYATPPNETPGQEVSLTLEGTLTLKLDGPEKDVSEFDKLQKLYSLMALRPETASKLSGPDLEIYNLIRQISEETANIPPKINRTVADYLRHLNGRIPKLVFFCGHNPNGSPATFQSQEIASNNKYHEHSDSYTIDRNEKINPDFEGNLYNEEILSSLAVEKEAFQFVFEEGFGLPRTEHTAKTISQIVGPGGIFVFGRGASIDKFNTLLLKNGFRKLVLFKRNSVELNELLKKFQHQDILAMETYYNRPDMDLIVAFK
jgi:hypothetical protein